MRAQLKKPLDARKNDFVRFFNELKGRAQPEWYPSLWVESRTSRHFQVNLKAQNLNEKKTEGLVLRVFTGRSLYEEALPLRTGEAFTAEVKDATDRLFARIQSEEKEAAAGPIPAFKVPTWADRLNPILKLDEEILSQIPKNVKSVDWVHFATPAEKEIWQDNSAAQACVQNTFNRLIGADRGVSPDYSLVYMNLDRDDFIFIDEETRLTQSIERNAIRLILMKSGERGMHIQGGLGGRETVDVSDEGIRSSYRRLKEVLAADKLKPGRYRVLLSPPVTGVLAHEAFGHTQEGDTWARGRSRARELLEQKVRVGNEHATILNNPAIYKNGTDPFAAWGSYYFDEEGWFATRHELVSEGFLNTPMTHFSSHVRLNVPRTANAKRENWSHGLYVRQTNTYFSEGDKTFNELLALIDDGFYAEDSAGGMEDPKGMGIQVGITYLHEVKNGKLTGRTFKGPNGGAVQMTGYVPDYLNSILAKSKIDAFSSGDDARLKHPWNEVGGCAKYHKEVVNAGCGGPFMVVDNVLLG